MGRFVGYYIPNDRPVTYTPLYSPYRGGVEDGGWYGTLMGIPGSGLTAIYPEVWMDVYAWAGDNRNLYINVGGTWHIGGTLILTPYANTGAMYVSPDWFELCPEDGGGNPNPWASDLGTWTIRHTAGPISYDYSEVFWDSQRGCTFDTEIPVENFLDADGVNGHFYIAAAVFWDGLAVTNHIHVPAKLGLVEDMKKLLEYYPASVYNANMGEFRSCNRARSSSESAGFVQRLDGTAWLDRKNREGSGDGSTVFMYSGTQYQPAPRVGGGA